MCVIFLIDLLAALINRDCPLLGLDLSHDIQRMTYSVAFPCEQDQVASDDVP